MIFRKRRKKMEIKPPSEEQEVFSNLDDNVEYIKKLLDVGENFDIIMRWWQVGNKRAVSFNINAMTNDDMMADIWEDVMFSIPEEVAMNTLEKIFHQKFSHTSVKKTNSLNEAVTSLLSGEFLFFLENEQEVIIIDARKYPARMPAESNIEKVTRGSRDSFVETIVFNTALIRRRLRDPMLRFEIVKVGTRSRTDIAVAYIKDIANPKLIKDVKDKLNEINADGIPMAEKAVEEYIVKGVWNPLPKVRYTERPDVAAVHLLEGHVCLIVDTSPNVMILPTTLFHHLQHVEEHHQSPLVGTWMRAIRLIGIILSLILPPLWLGLVLSRHILPESLAFLGPRDPGIIPLGIQFLLAELGVELVRMATIHVPSAQSTALGFIGAFMLGDFATKVGLFGNEVIFYTAIGAVGAFATPSIEFSMAVRMFRMFLIILTMLFKLPGFALGILLILIALFTTKSFGVPYMWPVFPFNLTALRGIVFRLPLPNKSLRPAILKPLDPRHLSENAEGTKEAREKRKE